MKKTLLAITILTSCASTAQAAITVFADDSNKVDLYGRVYAGYVFQDHNDYGSDGDSDSYFRTGFKSSSKISDSLKAISHTEIQWAIADDEKQDTTKTRLAFAGLEADWGTLTFGRQYTADRIVTAWTDNGVSDYSANYALQTLKRQSNVLKYEAHLFDKALTLASHAQLDTNDTSSYGLGAVYSFDFGLDLGSTYTSETVKTYSNGEKTSDNNTNTTLVSAQYTYEKFVAAIIGDSTTVDNGNDFTAVEASLQYTYKNVTGVFGYKVRNVDNVSQDQPDLTSFGLAYQFSKQFRTVAEYVVNGVDAELDSKGNWVNEDSLWVAARYDF